MWQRIQTLYLLIATVLLAIMFFTPIATIPGAGEPVKIMAYDKITYLILLSLVIIGHLVALNTFKLLILQMRVTTLTLLVVLGLAVVVGIDFFRFHDTMTFKIVAIFPVIALILDLLALRGIAADQALLESAYRLRDSRKKKK
ncbi:MAG: DUF4293 family protein [Bacteroidales bacterium]|nr:DUF4293 family protein [Bacteroidales bacterium]